MDDKLQRRAPSSSTMTGPERPLHTSTAFMFFNDVEALTVEEIAARIIPSQTDSPGAREAGSQRLNA